MGSNLKLVGNIKRINLTRDGTNYWTHDENYKQESMVNYDRMKIEHEPSKKAAFIAAFLLGS